ncbi:MAG: TIM barrel protein, partial [Lachnospiraceae bacterium]|nr:TIM barrel protein [Lachnospiraceae bacterium]
EITRRVKARTGISRFIANGMFDDKEGAEKWAKLMKAWAEAVEEDDCMIIYHNHDMELDEIEADGRKTTALEHFFALAGDKVMMQIDLGWAAFAAGDPYAVLSKYKDRIVSIHLKDLAPEVLKPGVKREDLCADSFVAIGEGGVDYSRLPDAAAECKNFDGCFIIDQDNSAGSMIEDLKKGCAYIRSMSK